MVPHPNNLMMLADIRNRALQDEAARIRLLLEAQGDGHPKRAALATAHRQLDAMIIRVRQTLESVRWTPTLPRRAAVTR
jgi:hypothetical protein